MTSKELNSFLYLQRGRAACHKCTAPRPRSGSPNSLSIPIQPKPNGFLARLLHPCTRPLLQDPGSPSNPTIARVSFPKTETTNFGMLQLSSPSTGFRPRNRFIPLFPTHDILHVSSCLDSRRKYPNSLRPSRILKYSSSHQHISSFNTPRHS